MFKNNFVEYQSGLRMMFKVISDKFIVVTPSELMELSNQIGAIVFGWIILHFRGHR